jgi:hypothetical protein
MDVGNFVAFSMKFGLAIIDGKKSVADFFFCHFIIEEIIQHVFGTDNGTWGISSR